MEAGSVGASRFLFRKPVAVLLLALGCLGILYNIPQGSTHMRKASASTLHSEIKHQPQSRTELQNQTKPPSMLTISSPSNTSTTTIAPFSSSCNKSTTQARYNITVHFSGRLGNKLFKFASMLGIAAQNNMNPVVSVKDAKDLSSMFDMTHIMQVKSEEEFKKYKFFREHHSMRRDKRTLSMCERKENVFLYAYLQSYLYFEKHKQSVLRTLTFLPEVQKRGRDFVEKQRPGLWGDIEVTKVGIHVRRGDFLSNVERDLGRDVPDAAYFEKAMTYMKEKYHNVVFIVASDAISWAKKNLKELGPLVFSEGLAAHEDMALLASCDHVIMSCGSFSWWAAWLANGTTIYYGLYPRAGSRLDNGFVRDQYYPPYWIPMN